jgi:hypothetical protein
VIWRGAVICKMSTKDAKAASDSGNDDSLLKKSQFEI